MKSFLLTVLLVSLCHSGFSFVPNSNGAFDRKSQLSLFGNSNKDKAQKKAPVTKKMKTQQKQEEKKPVWKKFARIAVTGSPDGISLLG